MKQPVGTTHRFLAVVTLALALSIVGWGPTSNAATPSPAAKKAVKV